MVQSSLERMQWFLTALHESCYHLVGSMGPSLGRDLYNIPDLALAVINSILSRLQVSSLGGFFDKTWVDFCVFFSVYA